MLAASQSRKSKLSFVLPVTLKETGQPQSSIGAWRVSPDDGVMLRTKLLFESFAANSNRRNVAEVFVVAPERDLPLLHSIVRSVTDDRRYMLVPELEVCRNIEKAVDVQTNKVLGWRAQQMIKLAISECVSSEHYITLDSDIVCIRKSSHNLLVQDGKALTNRECPADYKRIYTDSFARIETRIKQLRYEKSGEILGYPCLQTPRDWFYGETPVVLCISRQAG
jgi:Family of unknown function (DUF6492)